MAERQRPQPGQVISGTHGYLWWDGSPCFEVTSFSAKLKTSRETIKFAGQMMEDSKLMGLSGEWSAKIKKVYSRGREFVKAFMAGQDPRLTLIGKLQDPDNGGIERVQITGAWLDEISLMDFENGKIVEEEYGGGFTDCSYLDAISDPC